MTDNPLVEAFRGIKLSHGTDAAALAERAIVGRSFLTLSPEDYAALGGALLELRSMALQGSLIEPNADEAEMHAVEAELGGWS